MKRIALVFLVAWIGHAAQAQAIAPPTGDGCGERKPLYDPDHPPAQSNPWQDGSPWMPGLALDLPVAFASSGDECLGPIPVYSLYLHNQEEPDTHAMARKLAPEMKVYSQLTGEESCARMCRSVNGGIVARVVTVHAHAACTAPANSCPEHSSPMAETIHSHTPRTIFMANEVDALGWDEPAIEGKMTFAGYPDSLSPPDRRQAPLWLVGSRGQLIWLETPDGREVERP